MEIILREAIDRLGGAGDVVKVKDGYARNFLLPQKKAYLATPGNLKVMGQEKTRMLRREAAQRSEAEKLRELLSAVEIDIERRVGEHGVLYGSVTSADIAELIGSKGFTIDKRKILLDEHIKEIGEFRIPIRLFTEVTAEVTLRVVPEGDAAPVTGATSVAEEGATSVAEEEATSVDAENADAPTEAAAEDPEADEGASG